MSLRVNDALLPRLAEEIAVALGEAAQVIGIFATAYGLAQLLSPPDLTVIVNTADDFEHLGLRISPDLDTVCYTLAGLANPRTGWGRADETWNTMDALEGLGAPGWFRLGDKDIATHLRRTLLLRQGERLSGVVRGFCSAWGIDHLVLPMTDETVSTIVETEEGALAFQEYFVHRQCKPRVRGFRFAGIESALPAPEVIDAILGAEFIVICPSNPWVSTPILAFGGTDGTGLQQGRRSILIIGVAPEGPAADVLRWGSNLRSAVAHYQDLCQLVLSPTRAWPQYWDGMRPLVTKTIMRGPEDRTRLAKNVLDFLQAKLR
jgi:LPPG:FO 2-phospho-L-lactate transferase